MLEQSQGYYILALGFVSFLNLVVIVALVLSYNTSRRVTYVSPALQVLLKSSDSGWICLLVWIRETLPFTCWPRYSSLGLPSYLQLRC